MLLGNACLFLTLALAHYYLTGSRVSAVKVFLPSATWRHFVFCWALRVALLVLHCRLSVQVFRRYLDTHHSNNAAVFVFSGLIVLGLVCQVCASVMAHGPSSAKSELRPKWARRLRRVGDHRMIRFW